MDDTEADYDNWYDIFDNSKDNKMNYIEIAEKMVKKSLSLGADAAEVYLQLNRNLSIQVL